MGKTYRIDAKNSGWRKAKQQKQFEKRGSKPYWAETWKSAEIPVSNEEGRNIAEILRQD